MYLSLCPFIRFYIFHITIFIISVQSLQFSSNGIQSPEHLAGSGGSLGYSNGQQLLSLPKLSLISGTYATKTPPVLRRKPLKIIKFKRWNFFLDVNLR